jgi:hypothetical protein
MNYQKIHDAIIDRARNRTLQDYFERHHIIPKCLGGTDNKENLVDLTAREHFIVHKLLCKIYPNEDKLFFAYRMMAVMKNSKDNKREYYISSREFEEIRLLANKKIGNAARGRKLPPKPQEVIDKVITTRKQNGYRHSDETRKKISEKNKGRILSKEHIHNLRESHLNNPKCTGKAATPEKEEIRKQKIKDSWVIRKLKKVNKL